MTQVNSSSILIVDDEPSNFSVIKLLLLDQPYTLHYVASGVEAINSLELFEPDIILLDVMMPGLDGIQVCQQVKALPQWKAVPIIMVTALNTKEDLAHCLDAGADDFISKPVSRGELRARIQSMLRLRQQYTEIQSLSQLQQKTIALLEHHLQELQGNLTSRLGHELKTPLNGILASINLLKSEFKRINLNSETINDLLDILNGSSLRLERLTRKFLNYFKLELKTLEYKKEVGNHPLIEACCANSSLVEEYAMAIAQKAERSQDLICQIEAVDLNVLKQHLQWITEELAENAFKFSQPQTPVMVHGKCQSGLFHLKISNLGRGMTDEQIANIGVFIQFEREKYEQQGLGLGLVIAQRAVELYGGELTISSVYHQEIAMHLTLPIVAVESHNN